MTLKTSQHQKYVRAYMCSLIFFKCDKYLCLLEFLLATPGVHIAFHWCQTPRIDLSTRDLEKSL